MDFARAKNYALERLAHELPEQLAYHNQHHTIGEVVPAVAQLANCHGVTGQALTILLTAAYYHDLGFIEDRTEHEQASARIAQEILPHFGYTAVQIATIQPIIMATRLPQTPQTPLAALLADADLDIFGRSDFLTRNQDLRRELAATGQSFTDEAWYTRQLIFVRDHDYFTAVARNLWNPQKQANIQQLEQILATLKASQGAQSDGSITYSPP